ncbi:MAG: DUF4118 domain-containing protein [Proteobacteria bacterium]|nr:DUF4118 domain-containing protein [Pseudomonadota bacterium]MBU1738036.1 DUF4118 domain-containing protein [Pseudomonadota bacterium]
MMKTNGSNHLFVNFLNQFRPPWTWCALSMFFLLLDYLSGPHILFPVTFILPVGLAAWFGSRNWALSLAILLPILRFQFIFVWDTPLNSTMVNIANVAIRIIVLTLFALLLSKVAAQARELRQRVDQLEKFLPICSFCKKIRDQDDVWHPVESYISKRTQTRFSHSFCPECAKEHYPEYFKE